MISFNDINGSGALSLPALSADEVSKGEACYLSLIK